ncbi:MAG: hypothetical protein KF799_13195 [Bdellovibrionales bacterium]|nr:hypothetical protein [Bdellovibrionales bacterium]
MMRWCGVFLAAIFLVSCQVAPTRVNQSQKREFQMVVGKTQKPIDITNEQTVILDTRPAFDYGLNRVQNSRHFPWQNLSEKPETGELLRDPRQAALKLSLAGMTPSTPVVIVGKGLRGDGEEGRLAWTLLYLGFHDVQTASVDLFRKNWTQNPSPPAQNVAPWTPSPRDGMLIATEDFRVLAANPKERLRQRAWIIDARSAAEYFNKDAKAPGPTPDIQALQIEWKEFFNSDGRPSWTIRKRLNSLGIRPEDRIVVISNRGVRSSAAAYALTALGFTNVQNFLGGWRAFLP